MCRAIERRRKKEEMKDGAKVGRNKGRRTGKKRKEYGSARKEQRRGKSMEGE